MSALEKSGEWQLTLDVFQMFLGYFSWPYFSGAGHWNISPRLKLNIAIENWACLAPKKEHRFPNQLFFQRFIAVLGRVTVLENLR